MARTKTNDSNTTATGARIAHFVEISDVKAGTRYVAAWENECECETDRSVYREVVKRNDVITMGSVIGRPAATINGKSVRPMNAHLRPRNGAELVSEKLSDGSLVWNVALVIGEQTIIVNMLNHFAAESFAEDFNHRVARGHIVGA